MKLVHYKKVLEAIEFVLGSIASVAVFFVIPSGNKIELGEVIFSGALEKWKWNNVVYVVEMNRTGSA